MKKILAMLLAAALALSCAACGGETKTGEQHETSSVALTEASEEPEDDAPESVDEPESAPSEAAEDGEQTPASAAPASEAPASEAPAVSEDEQAPASSAASDALRPDFKAAMDDYEAFIDEYVSFMTKYAESDGADLTLLADYASYLTRYGEMMQSFEAWESDDLSDAELAYYIEVQSRVSQKLLSVAA